MGRYFLFAASLIVFLNQFACMFYTEMYEQAIQEAIDVMNYCAEIDPQAERLLEIMEKFQKVVEKRAKSQPHLSRAGPPLSADLSGLYNRFMGGSRSSREHASSMASVSSSQGYGSRTTSVHSPSVHHIPVADLIIPQHGPALAPVTTGAADTQMKGMSPVQATAPAPLLPSLASRPSVSSHSMAESSDSFNGEIEVDFDGLWSSWANHAPAPMGLGGPPGMATLGAHFSPPLGPSSMGAGPFGPFTISGAAAGQVSPPQVEMLRTLPLYQSSGYR